MTRARRAGTATPILLLILTPLLAVTLSAQERGAVQRSDYAKWESLGAGELSPDGLWLTAGIRRVSGDDELRIHRTDSDSLVAVPYGSRPAFSEDSGWLAYAIGHSDDAQEQAEEPLRNDLEIMDLRAGTLTTYTGIQSFAFGGSGRHLAMARYPAADTRVLVVEEMATGDRISFGSVADWSWQDDGALLAFTVHGEDGVGTAVQLYDAETGRVRTLHSGQEEYAGLAWREDGADLAVLQSFEDESREGPNHRLLAWRGLDGSGDSFALDPVGNEAIGEDERIVDFRGLQWSDDRGSIFFGVTSWEAADSEEEGDEATSMSEMDDETEDPEDGGDEDGLDLDPAGMEIWRWSDERTLPTQKRDERRDERANDLFVWHLDSAEAVRLSDDFFASASPSAGGRIVTAVRDDPYAFDAMFGRGRIDLWVVDPESGERERAAQDIAPFGWGTSPDGGFVHYYRGGDWYAYEVDGGRTHRLSEGAETDFARLNYDHPVDEMPSYGSAGWTADAGSLVVYDEFDLWELPVDGAPRRITDGRADEIIHRRVRIDPDEDGIDLSDAIVSLRGKWTHEYGYARLRSGQSEALIYRDDRVYGLERATDADVWMYGVQDYDDSPDYFVGRSLDDVRQVTDTNPFQNDYAWGRSELVQYENHNGVPLQGALFYPANYDPSRTYPMIVYIYEIRSPVVRSYSVPTHRNYYNTTVWNAEGYFVLQPDIVFDARDPGISSAKTLERAVGAVVDMGLVDPDRVGLVGHSWGGYQAQFVPTYTDVFAASVSGAGISNLVTMYGSIFWVAGAPESGHFEVGQERMEVPYYVDRDAYIRNSAVFNVESLNTPLLLEVGDSDQNVDWRQSIELYNIARRAGKPVTMLVYYDEDHGLRQEENQADYQHRIMEWFDHYLKGAEPARWIDEGIPWLEQKDTGGG